RGRRAEGHADRRCERVREARQLPGQRRSRDRGRRPTPRRPGPDRRGGGDRRRAGPGSGVRRRLVGLALAARGFTMRSDGARRYPPITVLLGGPSAEHDVSIVSGTAVADTIGAAGLDVRQVLIDLGGAWWWLPADHRRGDRPQSAYDDPRALGADGPHLVG